VLCACETAFHIKIKKKQAETALEFDVEEVIWSLRGRSDGSLEKAA
jgi:hypothetical protein